MAFGAFAWTGQAQPMAPKPPLDPQHAQSTAPDTAWTTPPARTGQGGSAPQPVQTLMGARGIARNPSWAFGHRGTAATAQALAPVIGAYASDSRVRMVAQRNAAIAHGDRRTATLQTHAYNPSPQREYGEGQSVDIASGHDGPQYPVHAIVHDRPGGQFLDGSGGGEMGPTGFRLGVSRRWAGRSYTSPALGAMYSRNTLRGVLPQIVATPHNQPALAGVMESGIASNARALLGNFTWPAIFNSPPSVSDQLTAAYQPNVPVAGGYDPVMGSGMM
jgi:hypothetical protein